MDVALKTKKAMSKEETALLVDLVASHPILTKKETNATTNKMKEETWTSLTSTFNAKCGSIPRTKDQLKLKWDNLKKAARKRAQQIRMNNLKTGGGKGDFIPPDEILEKVSGLLGSTVTGFEVPFGGDGIGCESFDLDGDSVDVFLVSGEEVSTSNDARTNVPNDVDIITPTEGPQPKRLKVLDTSEDVIGSSAEKEKSKYFFGAPMSKKLFATPTTSKGKKNASSDGRLARNLAIAKYYEMKTEKVKIETELLKLKLENEKKKFFENIPESAVP